MPIEKPPPGTDIKLLEYIVHKPLERKVETRSYVSIMINTVGSIKVVSFSKVLN